MEDKKLPVDREKLLIGLEVCRTGQCKECPYHSPVIPCWESHSSDLLAYIYYLEEQLEEARDHDCG